VRITLMEKLPYIWRCVSPLRGLLGVQTHYFIHLHIRKHISPFEVFGGKDTLFKAFSKYVKACFTFEEGGMFHH